MKTKKKTIKSKNGIVEMDFIYKKFNNKIIN